MALKTSHIIHRKWLTVPFLTTWICTFEHLCPALQTYRPAEKSLFSFEISSEQKAVSPSFRKAQVICRPRNRIIALYSQFHEIEMTRNTKKVTSR